jgi:hypothetical protein
MLYPIACCHTSQRLVSCDRDTVTVPSCAAVSVLLYRPMTVVLVRYLKGSCTGLYGGKDTGRLSRSLGVISCYRLL